MTTSGYRESAKIYQFPTKVRGHREDAEPAANLTSPRVALATFGSGWYHEEAIQDAERARKN